MHGQRHRFRAIALATIMLLSMVGGVATFGGATDAGTASTGGFVVVEDQEAGQQTNHVWLTESDADGTAAGIELDYGSSGTDLSSVGADDVGPVRIGSSTYAPASVTQNEGTLEIVFEESAPVSVGDSIEVRIEGNAVGNPTEAGVYQASAALRNDQGETITAPQVAFEIVDQTVQVSGTVTDSGGNPIDGASITAFDLETSLLTASQQTDSQGTYTVTLPTDRTFELTAAATGFNSGNTQLDVGSDSVSGVDFTLTSDDGSGSGQISGTIVDSDTGDPIEGASVAVEGEGTSTSTTTDAQGQYSFDLESGTYDVFANADGYESDSTTGVEVVDGDTTAVDFALLPDSGPGIKSGFTGTVVDQDGNPIEGASVGVLDGDEIITSTLTDAQGYYELGVGPGTYDLVAAVEDIDEEGVQGLTVDNDSHVVTQSFQLSLDGSGPPVDTGVYGVISDAETGDPIAGAQVGAFDPETGDPVKGSQTGEDGSFALELPAGQYTLKADASGYEPVQTEVELAEGDALEMPVDLVSNEYDGDTGTIAGTVTDADGNAVGGAELAFELDGKQEGYATTDSDGNYEIELPTGEYRVVAFADGFEPVEKSATVSTNQTTTLDVQFDSSGGGGEPATATGVVTDTRGNPIEGIQVVAYGGSSYSATTDENGQYEIDIDDSVRELLFAPESDEWGGTVKPIRPESGETLEVNAELAQAGTIEITVVDSDGTPLTNTPVYADGRTDWDNGQTDEDGTVTFDLGGGNYQIVVERPDGPTYVERNVEVVPNEQRQIELQVPDTGTIEGSVTLPDGSTPDSGHVRVEGESGVFFTELESDGTYSVDVFAGSYRVVAFDQNGRYSKAPAQVTVGSGDTVQADPITLSKVEVVSSSVEAVGDTDPNMDAISINPDARGGALRVVFDDGSRSPIVELGQYGVTEETVFEIDITVSGYDPDALFWAGSDLSWEATENATDPALTDITIRTSPVKLQAIKQQGIGLIGGRSPEDIDWPTGSDDVADLGRNKTVALWMMDLDAAGGPMADHLDGVTVTTNAQLFSRPRMVNGSLEVWVAGPGLDTQGQEHDGFYRAFIPDDQLEDWGIDDPEVELATRYKGDSTNFEVNETDDGAWISLDISYSEGTIEFDPDPESAHLGVASPGLDVDRIEYGDSVSVSTTVENVGGEADNQTVRLEVDGQLVDTETVDLAPGEKANVSFTADTSGLDVTAGEVEVRVESGDDAGTTTLDVDPTAAAYANEDGVIDTGGLRAAVDDWQRGDASTDLLLDVIDHWQSADPVS